MATQLDLQEQEQLDALKAFWKQYGNLITWTLVLVLGAYAGWNGWQYYQRDQARQAAAMFDELERSAGLGDAERVGRVFDDLQARYGATAFASQGGLLAARVHADKGQAASARSTLAWVADNGSDEGLRALARLRLAGLLIDAKEYDAARQQLDGVAAPGFEALVADRRGDLLAATGKPAEAKAAYEAAYKAMDERLEYRRLIDAKLAALGAAAPAASGAAR